MRKLLLAVLPLALACGDSGDSTGNPPPVAATVFEIQSGDITVGTEVEVLGYVIGISSNGSRLWISDGLAAAARTGVEVFRGNGAGALEAVVGDRVIVTATYQEFGSGAGLTVSQLANPSIEVAADATAGPIPLTGLDPAVITLDPIQGATANGEAYEGVQVQLANLEVASVSPFTLTDGTTTFGALDQIIALDDPVNTCYATVTGIWTYDVVTDEWVIVPTVTGLVAGGTCS